MGLDDALAAAEEAIAANRTSVDAACLRFVEIAIERGVPASARGEIRGWMVSAPSGMHILIRPDGSWSHFSLDDRYNVVDKGRDPVPKVVDLEAAMVQMLITKRA